MTVAELLERTSSAELGEWQAFERAYGPLGREYGDHMLASLVDAVKQLEYATICLQVEDPDDVETPLPVARPYDVQGYEDEPPDEDDDETVEC